MFVVFMSSSIIFWVNTGEGHETSLPLLPTVHCYIFFKEASQNGEKFTHAWMRETWMHRLCRVHILKKELDWLSHILKFGSFSLLNFSLSLPSMASPMHHRPEIDSNLFNYQTSKLQNTVESLVVFLLRKTKRKLLPWVHFFWTQRKLKLLEM